MIKQYYIFALILCFITKLSFAQNPSTITFPNPTPNPPVLTIDSYTKAATKINLQPGSPSGFKYGFITPTTPPTTNLLNLSIGTYASNVSNNYVDTLPANNIITVNPNLELGVTEGQGNVNPIGAFTYQFPIYCSPGTAGMQPNLSVSYNSNGSVSNMGLGFGLSGISSISRTNKLFFYDGVNKGIDLNYTDAFSLDGERLLLKTGTYGQNGCTYKTEVENYFKITSVGTSGNGPNNFVVYTPDGKTLEFGNSSDSKLKAANNNEVMSWFINKVTDEFGNYMSYFYNSQNGEINIDRIEYTGNVNAGLNPYNKIKFEYTDRSDKKLVYFGGGEFNQTKILKSITCTDINNQLVRKYGFDYQYNNVSLLSKITEVDASGNQLNPTYIDWTKTNLISNSGGGFALANDLILAESTINTSALMITSLSGNGSNLATIAADLNGDGKKDLVSITCKQGIYAGPPQYFVPIPAIYEVFLSIPSSNPNQQNDFQKVTNPALFNGTISGGEIITTNVYDEDDDNIEEIFITFKAGNMYWIEKIKSDGTNYTVSNHQLPKTISTTNSYVAFWGGSMFRHLSDRFVPYSSFLITKSDFTGDNKLDELIVDQEEIKLIPSNSQPAIIYPISDVMKVKIGDLNGDGVSEIFLLRSNSINCPGAGSKVLNTFIVEIIQYNSSNNTLNTILTQNLSPNILSSFPNCASSLLSDHFATSAGNIDFEDFNGDGKTDILFNEYTSPNFNNTNPGYANFKVHYSTGTGLTNAIQLAVINTGIGGFNASFFASDINNDGKMDWVATAYDYNTFISMFNVYQQSGNSVISNSISYSKSTKFASCLSDFDGNGSLDYLSTSALSTPPSIEYNVFNRNTKQFVSRIYNIKNDLKIEYSLLVNNKAGSNYPLYKKSTSANPNTISITKIPLHVVNKTNNNDIEKNYAYENALFHREAKGFLGFEKFYTLDVFSNILSVSSFLYDGTADFLKSNSVVNGLANTTPNTFLSINTNNISSKNVSDFYYTNNGNTRYLAYTSSVSKDYLKSTNSNNVTTYDNTKDGKVLSSSQFSTPWNSSAIHIIENNQNFSYISVTNPITSQSYYKPLKIITTKNSNGSSGPLSSVFHTDFNYIGQLLNTKIEYSNISGHQLTSTYSNYNNFGFPLQIAVSAPDISAARSSQVVYDATGRFVIKTTNAIGNFEEYTYEPKYGNKTSSKSITGLINTFEYDGFGRLIKTITPSNAVNIVKYEWYSYTLPSNPSKTYYAGIATTKSEGSPVVIIKYDINDNVVETNQEVFGGANKITKIDYNVIGQKLSETEVASIIPSSGSIIVINSYDAFLRPSTITQKVGNNILRTVNYSYNNISTDVTYVKGFAQIKAPTSNIGQFTFTKNENNEAGQIDKKMNYSSTNSAMQHVSNINYNQFNRPLIIQNTFGSAPAINTTINYDALGRQQQLVDPSSGNNIYQYNTIGELVSQTTPNGNYTFTYDLLGRIIQKSSSNNNYSYQYVSTGYGKQELEKIIGPNEITEYKYDALDHQIEKKQTITSAGNKVLKSNYTYDKYDNLIDYTYPGGFITTNEYDANGNLIKIKNNNTVIWQLNNLYTPDLISQFTYANGLVNVMHYDGNQNLLHKFYGSLQQQFYNFSPQNKDMLAREQNSGVPQVSNNETFVYDGFNRLTTANYYDINSNLQNKANLTYNQNGNIDFKDDCGNYAYGQSNAPYQLTAINNPVANNISLNTLNITYNDFKKVSQVNETTSNKQFNFIYGNDEERIKMDYTINSNNQYTRFYTDNYDRQETSNNYKEWNYIYAPTGLAAVYYNNNGSGQLLYASTDNLGSVTMLTYPNGTIAEEYSFDAWGRRRNPANWNDYVNVTPSQFMIRGFTTHEHLDEVGIINMNGRIYDPVLGRFLQADNEVQNPDNLQNYNRYSYVMNNPLKYTDPSGNDYVPAPTFDANAYFSYIIPNTTPYYLNTSYSADIMNNINMSYNNSITGINQQINNSIAYSKQLADEASTYILGKFAEMDQMYTSMAASLAEFANNPPVFGPRMEDLDLESMILAHNSGGGGGRNAAQINGILANPTSGALRLQDRHGSGVWHARRDGGRRLHGGIDILSTIGQNVTSPINGRATYFGGSKKGLDIVPSDRTLGIQKIRILYVDAVPGNGTSFNVTRGQRIGTSANLVPLGYPAGIAQHVHVQVMVGGIWVNPTPYFFGR